MRTKTKHSKLNIIIPAILLLVIAVVSSLGTAMSWKSTVQRMETELKVQAENHVSTLNEKMQAQLAVLEGYGASFTQVDLNSKELILDKLDRCARNTDFTMACFAYEDGDLYRNDGEEVNVDFRYYFQQAMKGNNVIQYIDDSPIDDQSRVAMAVPVVIREEIKGVLLGIYDSEEFRALFESTMSGISNMSYICDSDGNYIIGTKEAVAVMEGHNPGITKEGGFSEILEESEFSVNSKDQIMAQMRNGQSGQAVYEYRGELRHTFFVPLGINDWYIVSVLPEAQIYEQAMGNARASYIMLTVVMFAVLVFFIYLMIRERKIAKQEREKRHEIKYLFEHDSLTGVLSEKAFYEQVEARLKTIDIEKEEYCLVFMDVYKFKLFNEMFGYAKCDELLCATAYELEAMMQGCNGLCGRISGDNFILFMPHKEELIKEFYTKKYKKKRIIPVELYLYYGIYVVRDKTIPVARMVDCAQMAQKLIKGNYNNCVTYYDDKIRQKSLKEQEIISSMKEALENEEFVVYLQPQYDYKENRICGAEALVRWNSPTKGLIPPGDFIPVFESNGFIIKLDENVWEQVCKLQRKWLDEGKEILPISVNVSRADLLKGGVAEKLMSLIEKYELTADMIRVEITESAYMDNPQQLISEINSLEESGLIVEMDDFGTGYSSLNMLKDVPIQVLKTDLKFLSASGIESRKKHILESIIRMAHGMGMSVIAEGVETKEQADHLMSLKCDQMQGYYFSRPVPVSNYEELVYPD
ncbi:MAG: EAL domain-containing protein [Lachnospiraceae bacterium]|nr:EAL domain-containing protein [Lachnospiraceae bacterium]